MLLNKKNKNKEEECEHEYAPLMAKHRGEVVPLEKARVCLNCGILKVGLNTIKISNLRIDMDQKPIENVSKVDISSRLKIPVGTDMYD